MRYIEKYIIEDSVYGIEDYEDDQPQGDHFFAYHEHKRYRCWWNGCGLAQTVSQLEDARAIIFNHAVLRFTTAHEGAVESAKKYKKIVVKLVRDGIDSYKRKN